MDVKKRLYLNANLIYSEALNTIRKKEGKTLDKLGKKYRLFTPILTRFEVIQNLRLLKGKNIAQARKIYNNLIFRKKISEINSLNKFNLLTDEFIDRLSKTNLDFKDALHLSIAKKIRCKVCTHDKKILKGKSLQLDKENFYNEVYKPEELI